MPKAIPEIVFPSTVTFDDLGATKIPALVEESPVTVNPDTTTFDSSIEFVKGSPIVIPVTTPEASTVHVAPSAHATVTSDLKIANGA